MATTYEPIATTTLAATNSTISFSSIPATYTDLRIVALVGSDNGNDIRLRFNNDGGTNYSWTRLVGNGATASSGNFATQAYIELTPSVTPPTTPTALLIIDVFSYTGSTYKTALANVSMDKNGSGMVNRAVGLWRSTAAITSISLFNTGGGVLPIGTTATLYGIKAA